MKRLQLSFQILSLFLCVGIESKVLAEEASAAGTKIGAILSLSGDAASFGTAVKNGIVMAHESLSPHERQQLKIIFEDDRGDARTSVTALKRLIETEKVDVIINSTSGTGKALAPLAERAKIPLIAIASDRQIVRDRNYAVNLWVTPESEASLAVAECQSRGYRRIARISSVHEFNLTCREEFDKENKGRIEIVHDREYQVGNRDFRPFLTEVRKKRIDAIFVNLFFNHAGIFAKQAREMGIHVPLFAFEIFSDPSDVASSQGALTGQWYVDTGDPEDSFRDAYLKRFPRDPLFAAANGHDAVLIINQAVKEDSSSETINDFLHSLKDFKGALGTYSASGDNRFTLPAAVRIVSSDDK